MQDRCARDKEILGEKHIQTKATESTEAADGEDGWMDALPACAPVWAELAVVEGAEPVAAGGQGS